MQSSKSFNPSTSISSKFTYLYLYTLWHKLSLRRRFQLFLLFLLMILSGASELLSLGAVIPFLSLLSNPYTLWSYPFTRNIASVLGLSSPNELLLPSAFIFAFAAVFAAAVRLCNLWFSRRLAAAVGSDLSISVYSRTLFQTYDFHLKRNSSEIITTATTQISRTVAGITSFLQLLTSALVSIGISFGLFIIDWRIAFGLLFLFGSIYAFLALGTRRILLRNSTLISYFAKKQIQALQEGLGAIRDVLLDGTQSTYLGRYSSADRYLRRYQANNQFLSAFPRFAVEALGLVVVAFLGGIMSANEGNLSKIIPTLGAFALGAQRLLPALQQLYGGWSNLRGFTSDFSGVLTMLDLDVTSPIPNVIPTLLHKTISLINVSFKYSVNQPDVLRDINLEISKGERIGIIGTTGSGKTTLTDILMGLLIPSSGLFLIDGENLYDFPASQKYINWRRSIAHVPQNLFLSDCSILENIAFGVSLDDINKERVMRCAEQANISDFILSLPEAYDSFVGERGVRLSGGQVQRIGIARALYKQAQILVLDEATSALDTATEETVMSAVEGLSEDLTIIMIAHRLSTLKRCDRIVRLEEGHITFNASPSLLFAEQ